MVRFPHRVFDISLWDFDSARAAASISFHGFPNLGYHSVQPVSDFHMTRWESGDAACGNATVLCDMM